LRYVIDRDEPSALADLVADRRFHLQFAARLQSEANPVADRARNPSILCDSRHCREAQTSRPANHFENGRDRIDLRNGEEFLGESLHAAAPLLQWRIKGRRRRGPVYIAIRRSIMAQFVGAPRSVFTPAPEELVESIEGAGT
jgi:hypothetical protein